MSNKVRIGLWRLAITLGATWLTLLALLLLLAPRHDWAERAAERVAEPIFRCVKYPAALLTRDRHCAAADVWADTRPGRATRAWHETIRAVRLIRSEGGFDQLSTPAGQFWVPAGEESAIAEELVEQQENEYGDSVRGVHPGDVVLDCGASVGTFTRQALRRGASHVVAIEPAPWSLECLRRNLSEEIGQGRVVVYPKGVWDRDDQLDLTVGSESSSSAGTLVLGHGTRLTATVPLTTIDHLVAELGLPRVDFIKMDIEGAEPNALRGASDTVARFHPRLAISLEHRATDPETIPALTRRLWPDYRAECGPCSIAAGHLQPTMMFAH